MSQEQIPPTSQTTQASTSSSHPQPEPASIEGGLVQEVDSISELFDRDPLTWSEQDMVRMVARYRAERVKIDALPSKEKKAAAAATPKLDLSEAKTGSSLLDKLGL